MTMDFKKTVKKFDDLNQVFRDIRKESIEYLTDVCKRNGGKVDMRDDDNGGVCVTYDGGRHPEYASNAFSTVWSVWLKGDEPVLEIDEVDDYQLDRLDWLELYGVASYIYETFDCEDYAHQDDI